MKGISKDESSSGEKARLLPRDKKNTSTFQLGDDAHVLAKNKPTPITSHKTATPSSSRHERNATGLSEGNQTALSAGGSFDVSTRKKRAMRRRRKHLSTTKLLVGLCYVMVFCYTCAILIGPFLLSFQEESDWCPVYDNGALDEQSSTSSSSTPTFNWDVPIQDREYVNPDFIQDPCRYARVPQLLWLTLEECDYSRRMLTSVILGGVIGYERRTSDRPAGIRTMGLVSLGACFFTISSITAFRSSTMPWDASRVTAALPSGVGFLGAALIWKGSVGDGDNEVHQVHGLTTAASLWLSAAIGVGAGGALYFVSIYSTVLILLVLRFGPTFYLKDDDSSDIFDDEGEEESDNQSEEDDKDESAAAAAKEMGVAKGQSQRWLFEQQLQVAVSSPKSSIKERESDSFRSAGSNDDDDDEDEHPSSSTRSATKRSDERVSFHIQPGFPESLTTEDNYDMRSSSAHTLGESTSNTVASIRSTTTAGATAAGVGVGDALSAPAAGVMRERKRARARHHHHGASAAAFGPPTFHS